VPVAKSTEFPVVNLLQPLLRGQLLESVALPGRFSPHTRNITQSWVHLASGSQAFGGGKRTFFRSALLLSVTMVGDGIHGIGHALYCLQPKSHDWWSRLSCPVACLRQPRQGSAVASRRRVVAVSPGLLHALAWTGKRYTRQSPGRQGHACTVPRQHGWPVRCRVRPRASASRVVTRIGRWVGIFFPAPGRLPILPIEASANILTAHTGPILWVPSVPTSASLRARLGCRHVL
jgi:hypothetical protein